MQHLINRNFPKHISDRFMVRMDSDVFIPKEDETIFNRKKQSKEHMHIYFDHLELAEIPPSVHSRYFKLILFKSFRDAVKNGFVSIDKIQEVTDNKTARLRFKEKRGKIRKKLIAAFRQARSEVGKFKKKEVVLPPAGHETKESKVIKIEGVK